MVSSKNPYDVLGVSRTATHKEIKKAYRRQAREAHPDLAQDVGDDTRMKDLSEAYATLGDEGKRRDWDRDNPQVSSSESIFFTGSEGDSNDYFEVNGVKIPKNEDEATFRILNTDLHLFARLVAVNEETRDGEWRVISPQNLDATIDGEHIKTRYARTHPHRLHENPYVIHRENGEVTVRHNLVEWAPPGTRREDFPYKDRGEHPLKNGQER